MSDTFTSVLGCILQETGGNDNTWGQKINDQVTQYLENRLSARTTVNTTGGTTTLTQTQMRCRDILVTGALSSDVTIVFPAASNGDWTITNNTSNTFAVLVRDASSQHTTVIPQNTIKGIQSNSDGVVRLDAPSAGEMFWFGGTSVPPGSVECDGATLPRASIGLELFRNISTTWGVGNGSTDFNVPNAKTAGRYLRSRTGSVTIGTSQADQNASHSHTVSITSATESVTHFHVVSGSSGNNSADHTHAVSITTGGQSADHFHSTAVSLSGTTSANGSHAHSYDDHTFSASSTTAAGANPAGGTDTTVPRTTGTQADHTHTFSAAGAFASGTVSADHTHAVSGTTAGVSANHTHTISLNSATQSAFHTHLVSGTTATDGGTEARPISLVAMLCIRL